MIEKTLEQLGLNTKEIRVYLACLRLGPSPVRKIAGAAEINRGTTYDLLKTLIKRGLVSYFHQSKHQYFVAEDPNKLTDLAEEKYHKVLETKGRVFAIIPQLKSIYNNAQEKPVVKFYEGHAGAKTILQDVLVCCKEGKAREYFVYSSSEIRSFIYKLYPNFSSDRVRSKIRVKTISIGPGGERRGYDERRWMTQEDGVPSYTILYAGNVSMITLDSESRPLGFIIKDRNIYETQKVIFNYIWSTLK